MVLSVSNAICVIVHLILSLICLQYHSFRNKFTMLILASLEAGVKTNLCTEESRWFKVSLRLCLDEQHVAYVGCLAPGLKRKPEK